MPNQTRDVKDIFCEAREITSPQDLTAFLDQACGGDAQVRQQVEALLQAERQAGRFLGGFDPETTLPLETTLCEGPGTAIGRYKLLQELGHGGFGVVFMAEQQEPYRRVALKILKPGMDTKEIIARFAAEEQALALMEHPNIARVFDSGATASGRPYFVMELVQGVPITEYCDLNNLTPDERLQLFIDVCRAVQHAHQKGVIHRDLKPGNILVAVRDGAPVVKVIDFGIAKAVSQRLTNHTYVTRHNAILGTPLYMSPEQAGIKPLDVDTRTDIYSLGVVLYELLTGATPFDRKRLSSASPDEVCRIIREEEPPKPSTKIGTLGDTATTVAQHRKMEPRRLSTLIKGDLDWIVMKAMEKDRTRRYDTAKDLAEDVQRYLDHKPVEASPPSPLYRLHKFVRRNRRAGMMATAAAVMVLLGTVAMSAIVQRYDAERTAERQKELDAKIIPQIERYKSDEKYAAAVDLAKTWRHDFSDHPRLAELWHAITVNWTVITNERGARVSRKAYGVKDAKWEDLGLTPLDRLPVARGFFHWKIEKDGFDAVEGCAGPEEVEIRRDLLPAGTTPGGMVRVTFQGADGREGCFFIDRCEVTNREFKEFLDTGGYQRSEYWRVPIMQDGKAIALDDAIKTFVDSTGRPGPAVWANGTFPADQADFPVCGISWHEAAAYAQFRSKALPTIEQWTAAASVDLVTYIAPHSNMNSDGPAPVGSYQAPSQFGVYDVAGNVKEWCLNATTRGRRVVCGGAWEDPTYLFDGNEFVDPLIRWPSLGLRCLRDVRSGTKEPPTIVNEGSGVIEVPPAPSPEQLVQYKAVFRYNKQAKFNQTVVLDPSAATSYVHEIVEIDAAYASERLTLHIFLPKGHDAPYQTIVYFPGSGSQKADVFSLEHTDVSRAAAFVATGRAVCYPVYKGTFERRVSNTLGPEQGNELRVAQVKDLCRALDYLETRLDVFDMSRLVYVGFSWGAALGPLMMGIEDRFSACVLVSGGLWRGANYPELEPKTYVRLLDKPVLMINGAADWKYFSLAESQRPLFNAIPAEDKQHQIFPSAGHGVPLDEAQALIDTWLNEHFGPVGPPLPPIERADQLAVRATALLASNRYSQAEQLLKEAMRVYEGDLGKDHPNTLRTAARLADAMLNQKRFHEARLLLEATLKSQWAALGKNHEDTLETRKIIATAYVSLAGEKCWTQGKSLDEYREAVRFAQLSLQAYDLRMNQRLFLALAQYRSGEWDASAQTLKDVVKLESGRVNAWLLKAMVHKRMGQDALAASWFAAASEWMNKDRVTSGGPVELRAEAAGVLQLTLPWPPADWTDTQWIEQYDRLIQDQPDLPRLYQCRGSHYGRMQRWPEAIQDYSKSAELRPEDWGHQEALAVTCLQAGEVDRYKTACQSLLARLNTDSPVGLKATISVLCSLSDLPDLDRNALVQVADSALKTASTNDWVRLAKGMALYRQGLFEQTLQALPGENTAFANPKDAHLCLLFRAMAHRQLGDAYTSRKLLERARDEIAKQLAEPDGEELRFQDRPVAWCMVHVALREAESLIQAASHAQPSTAESPTGTSTGIPKK